MDTLKSSWPDLAEEKVQRLTQYYERVIAESKLQNLTKLLTPKDFVEGHLLDVRELLESDFIGYPALDLGSGAGVPGLASGMIDEKEWILVEAESRKADFLKRTQEALKVEKVRVIHGRVEDVIEDLNVQSITIRAVGPVGRIHAWIRNGSTWNNLILFKGPSWDEEWRSFRQEKYGSELKLAREHRYQIGRDQKQRVLVRLERVPRGT